MQTLFSQRLRAARQAMHPEITQREVAIRLGKSASAVNLWEKGKTEPGAVDLVTLSRWFQVSTDWLLGIESGGSNIIKTAPGTINTVPLVTPSSLVRWQLDATHGLLQTSDIYPSGTAAAVLVESEALQSCCPSGSYAVISKGHTATPGHIVLASVSRSSEPIMRKLIREGGTSLLVADDSRYPTFSLNDQSTIIGRVTEVTIRRMI